MRGVNVVQLNGAAVIYRLEPEEQQQQSQILKTGVSGARQVIKTLIGDNGHPLVGTGAATGGAIHGFLNEILWA